MAPRKYILPPMKPSFLRRGSEPQLPAATEKEPLLALTLTSPSFLDSSIVDEFSDPSQPLYRIKTAGTSTTVLRRDPLVSTVTAASIKWPKMIPLKRGKDGSDGVLLLMKDGRWSGGESLLKPPSKDGSRKFNIPNYNHAMKWKQYGAQYWCITPSVQGPIATFEPRKGTKPFKLTIYETLHDKHDPSALSAFRGVSILLLDYLIVTSLLLVTDLQEWMLVRKFEGNANTVPHTPESFSHSSNSASGALGAASSSQWRKIAFGEPIFPKIAGDAMSLHGEVPASLPLMHPRRQPPSIMTRSDDSSSSRRSPALGMRSFIDTELDSDDDSDSEQANYDISREGSSMRHLSSTAQSLLSSVSGPSHGYADSAFYRPQSPADEPALSSRPISDVSPIQGRHFHSQPSSPLTHFQNAQDMAPPSVLQAVRRARSVSPVSPNQDDPEVLTNILNNYQLDASRTSRPFVLPPPPPLPPPPVPRVTRLRSDSIGSSVSAFSRRPLPQPPATARVQDNAWAEVQSLRRAQSSNALREASLGYTPLRQPSPLPQQALPYTAQEPRNLPSSPGSRTTFNDAGPVIGSPYNHGDGASSYHHSHSRSQPHQPSTQQYLYPYNTDHVHSRQPPITKSSHEDLARWLHDLTIDAQLRDHTPEPLPSSTIYDVPPPAYSSIAFSTRPDGLH